MARNRPGRHAPAFLLLLLLEGPSYGLELLHRLNDWAPGNRMDSAIVYRTLKRLEEEGSIISSLDGSAPGPARKYYSITELGVAAMEDHAREIRRCVKNLTALLERYTEEGKRHLEVEE